MSVKDILMLRNSVKKNKITEEAPAVGLLYNDTLVWTDKKVELNGKRHRMLCIGSVLLPHGLDSLSGHFAGECKAICPPI